MIHIDALVVDFDRTLGRLTTDSALEDGYDELSRRFGSEVVPFLSRTKDPYGVWTALRDAAGIESGLRPLEIRVRAFMTEFEAMHSSDAVAYPLVVEVLEKLANRGVRIGVFTSNDEHVVSRVIRRWGLDDHVAGIRGRHDDVSLFELKPRLRALQDLMSSIGVFTAAAYIGDSAEDAACALESRLPFIGVLTGQLSRGDFESLGASWIIKSIGTLEEELEGSVQFG